VDEVLVAHLLPAYRSTVHAEVAIGMSRDAVVCAERGWKHLPFFVDAHGVERVRNMGVRLAYENKCDLLLMQDADTFATKPAFGALEALYRTMEKHDAAAVGAAVVVRNGERMNVEPARPGESYEGEAGTGLMLIDLRKLRGMPRPWFRTLVRADGETVQEGEDIHFCRLLKAHGHRVVVDYTFPTGHGYSSVYASRVDI
jgi:hypothetical protein